MASAMVRKLPLVDTLLDSLLCLCCLRSKGSPAPPMWAVPIKCWTSRCAGSQKIARVCSSDAWSHCGATRTLAFPKVVATDNIPGEISLPRSHNSVFVAEELRGVWEELRGVWEALWGVREGRGKY